MMVDTIGHNMTTDPGKTCVHRSCRRAWKCSFPDKCPMKEAK
jgi:hypothetical protein